MLHNISTIFAKSQADNLKNRLIKGAIGSFGLKIAGTGLTFAKSLIFARLLGTDGVGIYASAVSWTGLLSIPATLGFPQLIVREVAISKANSDWGTIRGLISWSNRVVLLFSIGLALIAGGIAWNLQLGNNPQMLLAFFVALISLPIASLTKLRLSAMQGLHKVVLGQLPEILIAPLLLITLCGIGYLTLEGDFNIYWAMGIYVCTIITTYIIGGWLLHNNLPQIVKDAVAKYQQKRWLSSGIPLMFLSSTKIIYSQTDILMLGALEGVKAVGIYVIVNRLSYLIVFILSAINSALAPNIATLYAEGKTKQIQHIFSKIFQLVLIISFPIVIIFMAFGKNFLLLFGSDFSQGYNALIILTIAQFINALTGPVGLFLNMSGNERDKIKIVAFTAALNVILNALLIPRYQIEGAATATAISTIILNFLNFALAKKKLGMSPINLKQL